MTASSIWSHGTVGPLLHVFFSLCLWKIHHCHPPLLMSLLCVSSTENWHTVNGWVFKGRTRLAVSQRGLLFFTPLTTAEKSKLFGCHTGPLKFGACSWVVPCPSMAGFIRAVSHAPATGQRHRAPSGPNQCWVPRERAIKQPYKTVHRNPTSSRLALIPHRSHD